MASQGQTVPSVHEENQAGPWERGWSGGGGKKAGERGESNGESQKIKIKKDTGAS